MLGRLYADGHMTTGSLHRAHLCSYERVSYKKSRLTIILLPSFPSPPPCMLLGLLPGTLSPDIHPKTCRGCLLWWRWRWKDRLPFHPDLKSTMGRWAQRTFGDGVILSFTIRGRYIAFLRQRRRCTAQTMSYCRCSARLEQHLG